MDMKKFTGYFANRGLEVRLGKSIIPTLINNKRNLIVLFKVCKYYFPKILMSLKVVTVTSDVDIITNG